MKAKTIDISPHLLWEYDLSTFDFDRSKAIIIERVIERGRLSDWQAIYSYYGKEEILEVAKNSKQLSARDKVFTTIFVNSPLIYAA